MASLPLIRGAALGQKNRVSPYSNALTVAMAGTEMIQVVSRLLAKIRVPDDNDDTFATIQFWAVPG
jgi:hypothetical protein